MEIKALHTFFSGDVLDYEWCQGFREKVAWRKEEKIDQLWWSRIDGLNELILLPFLIFLWDA